MQVLAQNYPTRPEMNQAVIAGAKRLREVTQAEAATNKSALATLDSVDALVDKMVNTGDSVNCKHDIRQQLGKYRHSFPSGAAVEVRKSYEKLRNLALDNTIERLEKGGSYPGQYFVNLPKASDIANFQALSPTFLRGGQPDQDGINWLKQAGVKSVIDLRGSDKNNAWSPPTWNPIKTFRVEIEDFQPPSIQEVEHFLAIVDNPDNQPSFVHCKAGIGRTGVMSACWNIAHGMSADEALKQEAISSYDGSLRQEDFVREFAAYWNSKPKDASGLKLAS